MVRPKDDVYVQILNHKGEEFYHDWLHVEIQQLVERGVGCRSLVPEEGRENDED